MPEQNEAHGLDDPVDGNASGLADRLRKLMEEQDTNARAVADKAGVGQTYVRDITHGKVKSPTHSKLRKVADVLGVSFEYLTTGAVVGAPSKADSAGLERPKTLRTPKFTIEGDLVHIDATLDREGVERLKGQLDHILNLLA